MADKQITRRLKIYVNGQEVDATITNLRKNLAKFRAQANRATEGSEDWKRYNKEVATTEKELKQAYQAQREFREQTKLTEAGISKATSSLTDFSGSLTQTFQGLKNGDFLQAKEGIDGIKNGLKGATRAAISFIATPIGAFLAILGGIAVVAREWFNYNQGIQEAVILTEQITKLQGEQADAARLQAETISKIYDQDYKETLETARNLVQQFGISYKEALDVIEDGLNKGGQKNDEFLQSLKEYPAFFKAAGFSVNEFKDIVNTGYDLGIYQDKLPDAIKEFSLAIAEQTDPTKDALVNAFGAPFTNELLKRVEKGEITVKTALQEISKEANKYGLNIQQNQQLTADLFKGAGEDAGGAIKVFEAINKAAAEANRPLTALEISTKKLSFALLESKTAQEKALKSDNFISFSRTAEIAWLNIKRDFFDGVKYITDKFIEINDFGVTTFVSLIKTGQSLPEILSRSLKTLGNNVIETIKTFGGLGDVISKVLDFDFDGAAQSYDKFKNDFSDAFNEVKQTASDTVDEIVRVQQEAKNAAQLRLDASRAADGEAARSENVEPGPITPAGSGGRDHKDELTPEDKKILESRKKLQEQLKQIEEEQELLKELDKIEKEEREEEEEILRAEKKYEDLIAKAEFDKDLQKGFEEAKEFELQQIRDKYAEERAEKKKARDKELLEMELKAKEQFLAAEENYQLAKQRAISFGLNFLQDAFGKQTAIGKAMFLFEQGRAVADIINQTSKAIATATANEVAVPPVLPPGIPNPAKPISLAATTKSIAAAKINAAVQIGSIVKNTIKGFDQGGESFEGVKSGGVDGKGGKFAILHPNEYIIPDFVRKDPEVPQIIQYLEEKRQRKLGSFESGGEAFDPPSRDIPGEITGKNGSDPGMASVLSQLQQTLTSGIKSYVFIGIDEAQKIKELQDKIEKTKKDSKN